MPVRCVLVCVRACVKCVCVCVLCMCPHRHMLLVGAVGFTPNQGPLYFVFAAYNTRACTRTQACVQPVRYLRWRHLSQHCAHCQQISQQQQFQRRCRGGDWLERQWRGLLCGVRPPTVPGHSGVALHIKHDAAISGAVQRKRSCHPGRVCPCYQLPRAFLRRIRLSVWHKRSNACVCRDHLTYQLHAARARQANRRVRWHTLACRVFG